MDWKESVYMSANVWNMKRHWANTAWMPLIYYHMVYKELFWIFLQQINAFQPLQIHSEPLRWHVHKSLTKVEESRLFANHCSIHVRQKWTDFRGIFIFSKRHLLTGYVCVCQIEDKITFFFQVLTLYLPRMEWLRKSAPRNRLFWWKMSYLEIQNNGKKLRISFRHLKIWK